MPSDNRVTHADETSGHACILDPARWLGDVERIESAPFTDAGFHMEKGIKRLLAESEGVGWIVRQPSLIVPPLGNDLWATSSRLRLEVPCYTKVASRYAVARLRGVWILLG